MTSEKKATRSQKKGAKEILRLGLKVLAYRRDLLPEEEAERLQQATESLREILGQKSVPGSELEEKAKAVDEALQKSGGLYYHKKGWVENVEMLLVAAIVVIGIRSFFLQPFIIPTNSMYPSFYGMQPHVYEDDEPVPNFAEQSVNKILRGASHFNVKAERSGVLYLVFKREAYYIDGKEGHVIRYSQPKTNSFPNGKFFLFPTAVQEYVFEIGGKEHSLRVPMEFGLEELLARKFANVERLEDLAKIVPQDRYNESRLKLSDRIIKKGEKALAFDILLGDALFVDRFSYNFIKPSAGDPAVFRTGTIDAFNRELGTPIRRGIGEDKYYIKRLVGEPGDTLEINVPRNFTSDTSYTTNDTYQKIALDKTSGQMLHPGILSRNGKPNGANIAFDGNRRFVENLQKGPPNSGINDPKLLTNNGYPGYRASGILSNGNVIQIPTKNSPGNPTGQNAYFALGDNSTDSLDGRAWGFVPEQAIVGRAFLIYYPFTKRWGFSE